MPRPAQFNPLPLPRGWPHRVRSSVIHVISVARTTLALSQSWASESMNRELRREAEGDRLQQEIQLLPRDSCPGIYPSAVTLRNIDGASVLPRSPRSRES
jgi:hypothetical protein